MFFKKITTVFLSAAMAFGLAGSVNNSFADEITDEYFKKDQAVGTWTKGETVSTVDADLNFADKTAQDGMKFNAGYTINMKSLSDTDNMNMYLEADFKEKGQAPKIPATKLYITNKGELYLNKEIIDYMNNMMGLDVPKFKTDFVNLKAKDFTKSYSDAVKGIKSYENPAKLQAKMIDFIKGIDLGVDIGFTKQGDTYKVSMDADKMVDVTDAYFKFIFKNPDYILNFYKDVLDMDLAKMSGVTNEEMISSMKQSSEMWTKQVTPYLPLAKQILKGSTFNMEQKFDLDNKVYTQNSNLNVVVNVPETVMTAITKDDKDILKEKTDKIIFTGKLSLKASGTTKGLDKLDIKIPEKADVYDFEAAAKKKQEEMEKQFQEQMKENEKTNGKLEKESYVLDTKNKTLTYFVGEDKIDSTDIDVQFKNGLLYVDAKTLSDFTGYDNETSEKTVSFKNAMTKNGFKVIWDNNAKTSTAVEAAAKEAVGK